MYNYIICIYIYMYINIYDVYKNTCTDHAKPHPNHGSSHSAPAILRSAPRASHNQLSKYCQGRRQQKRRSQLLQRGKARLEAVTGHGWDLHVEMDGWFEWRCVMCNVYKNIPMKIPNKYFISMCEEFFFSVALKSHN